MADKMVQGNWSGCLCRPNAFWQLAAFLTARIAVLGVVLAIDAIPVNGQSVSSQPAETQPAESQSAEPFRLFEPFLDIVHNRRLTGDWGGARTWLEERGVEFNLQLTTVYQHNVHGGLRTHHGHDITGRADYQLTLCTEPMGLWKGGAFHVFGESGWNDGISNRVGDLFGVNGATLGDEEIRVRELWYEQQLLEDKVRVKFGKLDLAVDLDTNAYANYEVTQFLNNALVNNGNIPLPDYGIGGVVSVTPCEWSYLTVAIADAQANGNETGLNTAFHDEDYFFSALEYGFTPTWETVWGKLPGGYRVGLWYDPQDKEKFFNDLDGRRQTIPIKRDDTGFYLSMDQLLFKEKPEDDEDTQGLGMFVRYGYAHADVNELEHFWSVGGQYQGLIPTRDNDVLGVGFAQGILSRQFDTQGGVGRESVYELYYGAEIFPWLHVSPDLQYIQDPGGDGRDAFVAGVRVQMTF